MLLPARRDVVKVVFRDVDVHKVDAAMLRVRQLWRERENKS